MTEKIGLYVHPELKILAESAANQEGLPLSEFVGRILAAHLGRPELGVVPRKKWGRPLKSRSAEAVPVTG